jgi:carbonic anhydrase
VTFADELHANNERYAHGHADRVALPPSGHLAVVACMDARLNVYGLYSNMK